MWIKIKGQSHPRRLSNIRTLVAYQLLGKNEVTLNRYLNFFMGTCSWYIIMTFVGGNWSICRCDISSLCFSLFSPLPLNPFLISKRPAPCRMDSENGDDLNTDYNGSCWLLSAVSFCLIQTDHSDRLTLGVRCGAVRKCVWSTRRRARSTVNVHASSMTYSTHY